MKIFLVPKGWITLVWWFPDLPSSGIRNASRVWHLWFSQIRYLQDRINCRGICYLTFLLSASSVWYEWLRVKYLDSDWIHCPICYEYSSSPGDEFRFLICDIFCFALLDNAKPRCWTWQKLPATTAHCSCTLSILKRAVPKTILGASKLQWQVPTNIQSFWGIEELNFLLFISLLTLCRCSRRCVGFPFKRRNNPKHSNTDLNVVCHGNG